MTSPQLTRVETDLLGPRDIVAGAMYGIHTVRAVENFPQVGQRVADIAELAVALGMVKLAALLANVDCGVIGEPVSSALEHACHDLIEDRAGLRSGLVVPLLQGGAGTSTNMNVNEVLANRALALLGQPPGTYSVCHPNDHVNRSQSTNDVYPTALRVALIMRHETVAERVGSVICELESLAQAQGDRQKLGRTQLQDAVPMAVAEEMLAWADAVGSALELLDDAVGRLAEVNLGGTAIGTGLNAPPGYRAGAVAHLRRISGIPVTAAGNPVSATTNMSALIAYAAGLRAVAVALAKAANDLRLLSSGPAGGLGEYRLPAVQAGSSMMPGKVNPVICEYVNQAAYRIEGAEVTIARALSAGELQLNAMLPVAAAEMFTAQELLCAASSALRERCLRGLEVVEAVVDRYSAEGLDDFTRIAAEQGYAIAERLTERARQQLNLPAETSSTKGEPCPS